MNLKKNNIPCPGDTREYGSEYSEESLWIKILQFAKKAGREVIEKVLTLYETLKDEDTPARAKAVIIGALGYFISPIDAVPDLLPGIGFSDDLVALAVAMGIVALHVKDEHVAKAVKRLDGWFGGNSADEPVPQGT